MAWWGKVIGGTFGFILGGPLGAMLGASLGHGFDRGSGARGGRFLPGDQERTQAAFFTATFSVMGHIAKADGQVTRDEITIAQDIMGQMQLDKLQKKAAIELFNQGKTSDFKFDAVLSQFRRECHRRTSLLQMFLEIQVLAAAADGSIDHAEKRILEHIAEQLGFAQSDLQRIIDMVRGAGHAGGPSSKADDLDPYKVLGVTPDTPMDEIKKEYRKLLSQHHPDKLVSKGLPEEMIKLANDKTHEIRTAWKKIQDIPAR